MGAGLWILAVGAAIALAAGNLWFGDLNQDEGWYLYAARLVHAGQRPYADFASTQGPVMPYVYAVVQPLMDRFGVAGGRGFTAIMGLLGAAGAAALARTLTRSGRPLAAFIAFALVGVNLFQSYFTTVVKTYALAALLLVLSFLALARAGRRRGWLWAAGAGMLIGLAAATRSSAGFAAPAVGLGLLAQAWGGAPAPGAGARGTAGRWSPLLAFGAGLTLTLAAVFGPFLLSAPQGVWFALYEYHAGRQTGGGFTALAYKAGFASRVVQAYFLAVAGGLLALAEQAARNAADAGGGKPWLARLWSRLGTPAGGLWLSVLTISLVHAAAPFPYDDYQAVVYPLAAAGVAAALADGVAGRVRAPLAAALVLALALLAAGSAPTLQGWFVGKRDRIWWPLKTETPLTKLRRTGSMLRERAGDGALLLTQDTYLAVESGLNLPRGLELGPFSYFPDWDQRKAERLRVLNRASFEALLAKCEAPLAAVSGYGLAIRCPEVQPLPEGERGALWALLRQRYAPLLTEKDFGQAETELLVLERAR